MANAFYATGIDAFNRGSIAALVDTLKVALVTTSYTPNLTTDQFFNIIPGGAVTAAGVALASKTSAAGTLSAANVLFTAVSGSASAYLVIYKDTGTPSTSQLIGLIDTATGLPVTPNGGDITVAWASSQVYTLFESLKESNPTVWERFREWAKTQGGLWLPEPSIVLS